MVRIDKDGCQHREDAKGKQEDRNQHSDPFVAPRLKRPVIQYSFVPDGNDVPYRLSSVASSVSSEPVVSVISLVHGL